MSDSQDLRNLLADVSMSRRALLRRAAVLGVSAPVLGSLLAACATDEDSDDDSAGEEAAGEADDSEAEESPEEDTGSDETPEEDETEEAEETSEETETDDQTSGEEDRYGGTLNVALVGNPNTLDVTTTTASIVGFFGWHIWEPLFTWDEDLQVTPHLAEGNEVSDDGLTNTISLRQGVLFHNGDEMTAEDVIASIERWFEVSPRAEGLVPRVDALEQVDDYTIEFQMSEAYGAFESILARLTGGCAISPASVVEEAGNDEVSEYIGTGPFQFVEYAPDQHIHLQRFEDYVSREEEPSGYAGRRTPYLDEIYFVPVSDDATRIAGLQSGDYHYLELVTASQFESLEGDESVTSEVLSPVAYRIFVFNTEEGVLSDPNMRKAMQATFDHEELAVTGHGEYFNLDPAILIEVTAWHTTAGEENYNMADAERAQELADEAGYDGQTIRFMTSQEQPDMYDMALVGQQQLEDAGFNVEILNYDWATLLDLRQDPAEWDIFTTGAGLTLDPLLMSFVTTTTWPGWWDSEAKVELVSQIESETEFEARFAAWEELQLLFYEEDVPMIKIADMFDFNARSPLLQGFEPISQVAGGVGFWNMWLEE